MAKPKASVPLSRGFGLVQGRVRRARVGREALASAPALVPAILTEVARQSGLPAEGWVVLRSALSGTQVVVMMVGPQGGAPVAVLKVPATADGLASQAREGTVLEALAGLPGPFRIPRRLAQGTVGGRGFVAEEAIPGVPGDALMTGAGANQALAGSAAAVITDWHRATGEPVVVGADLLGRWVDERVAALSPAVRQPALLERLGTLLRGAWEGREAVVSWVHGDFWPANVLFEPVTLAVTGIIDWEWAAPQELPAQDLCYLLIQARMRATGREFGPVVAALLEGAAWTAPETAVLEAGGVIAPGEAGPGRDVLLLVWLRHVAYNLLQHPGDARNWVWTGRNLEPVLRRV
ncbi:MAG TPA: aminoglycoside phosphotransferase family protein [Actinomycetota bacterium]|nr:aminoglycoside phosphotransferase family protein [Actinomycetota bacterium]